MTDLQPLYIALTGARDRAKHEGTPAGIVGLRAHVELRMCVIAEASPNDALSQRIEQIQRNALRIIEHTLKVMANDISKTAGCDVPASVTLKPDSITAITPEDEGQFHEHRQKFLDIGQSDPEAMNALSSVTAAMVKQWSSARS